MNPDETKAQTEFQARQTAVNLAHQRIKPEASIDELLTEAKKLHDFMMAGGKVANPERDNGSAQQS
jgi:translation initiation factor IF-3